MSDVKIIPDTNVIIAASIFENLSEISKNIKHEFYDESIQLFSLFKKFPEKKIGIILPKVKTESFGVLARAVKDVFIPKSETIDLNVKSEFYNNAASIIFSSDHKREMLLASLIDVPINKKNVQKALQSVNEMSKDLYDLYHYKRREISNKENRQHLKKKSKTWDSKLQKIRSEVNDIQIRRESKQLQRFVKKYPNKSDQRILAEAIAVKDHLLSKGTNVRLFFASRDTGFFSPYNRYGETSDLVTLEIDKRFDIQCDYPRKIFKVADGII